MQVKNNENRSAVEHEKQAAQTQKNDPVAEQNKTHDVKKQAEAQADKGKSWEKFAAQPSAQTPANVADQAAAAKHVESSQAISRADIEARLREHSIKA